MQKKLSLRELLDSLDQAKTPTEVQEIERQIRGLEGPQRDDNDNDEEAWREMIYRDIPQRDFAAMCGETPNFPKQTKQLQDMERSWGLPFAGASVNLYDFFPKLWVFLVKWGPLLKVVMEDETGDASENSLGVRFLKAKIAKTQEDARAAAIRNELREGKLLDRDRVHEIFEKLAARVQRANDRAQAHWGADGHDFMQALIQGFDEEIRGVLSNIRPADADTDSETEGDSSIP